jgi:hypothetical protein
VVTDFVKQSKNQSIRAEPRVVCQSSVHSHDLVVATNERLGVYG